MINVPVQRWYAGLYCEGRPDTLVETMAALVRKYDLARFIPVVRCERRQQGGRSRSGQFYMFLGIESPVPGQLPTEVSQVLENSPFRGRCIGLFSLDQIKSMVGQEMSVHDYARHIPYWRRPWPDDDPFGEDAAIRASLTDNEIEQTERFDAFLRWLSATASGTWTAFQSAYKTLGVDTARFPASVLARRLRLLGHLETSADGSRWSVTPPVLVRTSMSDELQTYVLCGGRDARVLGALERAPRFTVTPQSGLAPAVVEIGVDAVERILATAPTIDHTYGLRSSDDVPKLLARVLPPISGWLDMQPALTTIKPNLFNVRRFDSGQFRNSTFSGKTGFYELWNPREDDTPGSRPKYSLFYEARNEKWIRGDWYGLRYLAHYADGQPLSVHYAPHARRVRIQRDLRWPELYERVLVLSSGFLPCEERNWLLYENVESAVLDELTPKLNLRVVKDDENA